MKLYKLTDQHDQTYGGCQWGEGVTIKTNGEGGLCGPGFTHWYTDPLLAVLLNPIHGNYNLETAHLWEGEGEVVKTNHGLKAGCTAATTLRRIPLPVVTLEQKVRFGILCAMEVYQCEDFTAWANAWLSGLDRSEASAEAAAAAARAAGASARAAAGLGELDLIALAEGVCQ